MKNKILLLVCFLLLLVICHAQKTSENSNKDSLFYYEPIYLDSNFNVVKPLNLDKAILQVYQQVFKTTNYLIFTSSEASFKINSKDKINILVKINPNSGSENIKSDFKLFLLEVNFEKDYRRSILSYKKHFINSTEIFNSGIPIQFKKVTENSLILNFSNLAIGEYLLIIGKSFYTFSVN